MSYIQLVSPDKTIKADTGMCLWFTQEVYHVPHLYPSAWQAWLETKSKHLERSMPNVSVPVFFSHFGTYGKPPTYGNWGHVVAWIPSVGFLSSPLSGYGQVILSSIEAVEKSFNSKYVGWSEDISGIKIIKENAMTEDGVRFGILGVTGGQPLANYETEVSYWTGRDSTEFSKYLYSLGDYYMVAATKEIAELKKQISGEYIKTDVYIKKVS